MIFSKSTSQSLDQFSDEARRARVRPQHIRLLIGIFLLSFVVLGGLLAPLIAPGGSQAQDLKNRLVSPTWNWDNYLLGSDQLGRDLFSRLLYGARITLIVSFTAVTVSLSLGTILGLLSGYFEGYFDTVIMSIVDIQLALPFILLAILVATTLGPGLIKVILVLSLSGWVIFARLVRGVVLSLKHREYILASRQLGASDFVILVRHIVPNSLPPIIAITTPQVARTILAESALSFLGLSGDPLLPTWGGMLSDARDYIYRAPWMLIFPGLAIMMTVVGVNYFGDWLRHRLNPRLIERKI